MYRGDRQLSNGIRNSKCVNPGYFYWCCFLLYQSYIIIMDSSTDKKPMIEGGITRACCSGMVYKSSASIERLLMLCSLFIVRSIPDLLGSQKQTHGSYGKWTWPHPNVEQKANEEKLLSTSHNFVMFTPSLLRWNRTACFGHREG
jgi:hypothetical protein